MAMIALPIAPRAACHPGRRQHDPDTGRCRECWSLAQLEARATGPVRVSGVHQHGSFDAAPTCCPKCRAESPTWTWEEGAAYVICHRCGRDWHRLSDRAMAVAQVHQVNAMLRRSPRALGTKRRRFV